MASQPFYVPKSFERQLREYDRNLRVRWDHKYGYWRIERRVAMAWDAPPTSPAEWQAKADGYALVLQVPPDCLDFQVFRALEARDIQKIGARRLAEQMEASEARISQQQRAAYSDEVYQRSKERWTSWNTNYPATKQHHARRGDKLAGGTM